MASSTVYGPVQSWRFGTSLGIDPILHHSVCSFNCIYCQLGYIQEITLKQRLFVSSRQVLQDLKNIDLSSVDVITFSGSGEPTLAKNFSIIAQKIRKQVDIPLHILTNATTFHLPHVLEYLSIFDEVSCKLDALNLKDFQKINRSVGDCSPEKIINNIYNLRKIYKKKISIQIMLIKHALPNVNLLVETLKKIQPDAIYVNLPKRPYPKDWSLQYRGDHIQTSDQQHENGKVLPIISSEKLDDWIKPLKKEFSNLLLIK